MPYTRLTVGDGARREAEKLGETEVKKKAAELVRYALACEYQRVLIRKDDIRNKVFEKSGSRAFSVVFNAAQKMLHKTFGFHMVEVRPRGADNAELAKQAEQVLRAAASSANGLRPRGQRAESAEPAGDGSLGSNIWVLRSALPSSINKALVSVDQGLSKAFAQSTSSEPSTSTPSRRRSAANNAKAALDWSSADHQTGEMGLLYIILALILVNGRTISEGESLQQREPIRTSIHADLALLCCLFDQQRCTCTCGASTSIPIPSCRATCGALGPHLALLPVHRRAHRRNREVGLCLARWKAS